MIKVKRYHNGKVIPHRLPDFVFGEARDIELDLTGELHADTIAAVEWTIFPSSTLIGTPTYTDKKTTATVTAPSAPTVPNIYYPINRGYRIDIAVTTTSGEKLVTPLELYIRTGFE